MKAGHGSPEKEKDLFDRLSRMVLSKDEGILKLISRYMTLEDIFKVHWT